MQSCIAVWCGPIPNPELGQIKNFLEETTSKVRCKGCVESIQGKDLGEEEHVQGKRMAGMKENIKATEKMGRKLYKVTMCNLNGRIILKSLFF